MILLWLIATAGWATNEMQKDEHTAGEWRAWVESTRAGDPRARGLSWHSKVFRQGPGEAPVKLYEVTSGGRPFVALRDDGLLVLQGPGHPQVYFPGEVRPILLHLPRPRKLEKTYTPYDSLEKVFLFGDVLFYQRTAYPGDLMMGFVVIDAARESFTRNIAVLEVRDSIGGSETWAASLGSEPVRFREHILWLNRGQSNIAGIWREQRLWAVNLKSGKLIPENAMPDELLMNPLKQLTRPLPLH